jgi:hypothetical protein
VTSLSLSLSLRGSIIFLFFSESISISFLTLLSSSMIIMNDKYHNNHISSMAYHFSVTW